MAWGDPPSWSKSDDELAALLPVFYSKRIREIMSTFKGLWEKVETDPLATRSGQVATFMQYASIAAQAASTVLTEGVNPNPTDMVSGKITATVVEKGGVVAIPSLARQTIIDGTEKVAQVVGTWGQQSMERHAAEVLAAYLAQIRVDADATYEDDSITTSAGSTTLLNDTARTEANDAWIGGLVTIIDPYVGTYGEAQYADDSVQNTSVQVGTAFSAAIGDATRYHISIPTGIVAGDKLTLAGVRLAQKFLRKGGIMGPLWEIDGGGYNIVLDAVTEADIQADLVTVFQYKEGKDELRGYPDGKMIAQCRPTLTTIPFRSAVGGAGTYAETGIVHYSPVFGKNCLAKLPVEQMDVKVIAKGEKTGGTSNPLERYSTTGWMFTGAFLKRNVAAGVAILSGDN